MHSLLVKKHDFGCNVQFRDWAPVCGRWWIKLNRKFIPLYYITLSVYGTQNNNNNNNLFYIAPQQQLYELLALYRSTNAIEHTSICYLN